MGSATGQAASYATAIERYATAFARSGGSNQSLANAVYRAQRYLDANPRDPGAAQLRDMILHGQATLRAGARAETIAQQQRQQQSTSSSIFAFLSPSGGAPASAGYSSSSYSTGKGGGSTSTAPASSGGGKQPTTSARRTTSAARRTSTPARAPAGADDLVRAGGEAIDRLLPGGQAIGLFSAIGRTLTGRIGTGGLLTLWNPPTDFLRRPIVKFFLITSLFAVGAAGIGYVMSKKKPTAASRKRVEAPPEE